MTKQQEEKIKKFLADPLMASTVYDVLRGTFTKTRTYKGEYPSIEFLAAERIAADLLEEGWKVLARYAVHTPQREPVESNIGM